MTVIAPAPPGVAPGEPAEDRRTGAPRGAIGRAWAAPLGVHALVLGLLLVAFSLVADPSRLLNADEGAAAAQATELVEGRGWTISHPLPDVDPSGEAFPLHLSVQKEGTLEFAPFAKHPVYPVVLAGAMKVGGLELAAMVSIAGTVVAAVGAALIARRFAPGLDRWALWATGLASPLLFYSFVMIAHTLGAAFASLLVLAALRCRERPSIGAVAAAVGAGCSAALLRNEAVLFGAALALVLAVDALVRRSRGAGLAAGAALAGVLAGYLTDPWLQGRVLGGDAARPFTITSRGDRLDDAWYAFRSTVLEPAESGSLAAALNQLAVVLLVAAALVAARRTVDRTLVALLTGCAAVASVLWVLQDPVGIVYGMLFAFPLLPVGLVALRAGRRVDLTVLLIATVALFAGAVTLTQYRTGGTGWGGRFYVLAVPVIVPVLVASIRQLLARLDHTGKRAVAAAGLVVLATYVLVPVLTVHHRHRRDAALEQTLRAVTATVEAGDGDDRPVVVATAGPTGRISYRLVADQRWLLVEPADLPRYAARLRAAGIDRFVLIDRDPTATAAALQPHYQPAGEVIETSIERPLVGLETLTEKALVLSVA